ncbi:hypothetical protein JCM14469_22370 [Desulfatiferula olefinivorans]
MKIVEITSQDAFYRITKAGVCLADFQAPWCAPCHEQEPILTDLARRYDGRAVICGIDIDVHRGLAATWDIAHVPTLILFRNGRELERLMGLQSAEVLAGLIDGALAVGTGPL